MKPIASERKKGLGLNKRTIAALNFVEMAFIGGGMENFAAAIAETDPKSLTCITPDTTIETGITPLNLVGVNPISIGDR
jgi:hypothetical protein